MTRNHHQPVRTCIGCGARKPQAALVRFVAEQGSVRLDAPGHRPGRGAYVCGASCAQRALSRRAFGRALRQKVLAEPSLVEQVEQRVGGSAA